MQPDRMKNGKWPHNLTANISPECLVETEPGCSDMIHASINTAAPERQKKR